MIKNQFCDLKNDVKNLVETCADSIPIMVIMVTNHS